VDFFTGADTDILRLIAQGYTIKSICKRLNISERTVRYHLANVKTRLGAHSLEEVMFICGRDSLLGEYVRGFDQVA
jgi:DNA-binding NarL/FixJ family response regulator